MIKSVYLGSDNPTTVTFYRNGSVIDFTGVMRCAVSFRESDVIVDTSVVEQATLITVDANGVGVFDFGQLTIPAGVYSAQFTVYDALHDDGQVIVGYDDGLKFKFIEPYDFDLVVQDELGSQTEANAYIDLVFFKSYHNIRGNDYHSYDDFEIKRAIVRATDYVDVRFNFISTKLTEAQNTYWPRYGFDVIPRALREAVAEYALRALSANINPDPDNLNGGRLVKRKSEGLTPISESIEYEESSGVFMMPNYPAADEKLKQAGLIRSSTVNFLMRG